MPSFDNYNPTIRWIHLSDLHMTEQGVNRFNIVTILPSLLDDIKTFEPHFVLFSGDLSYSGKKTEYDMVDAFLADLSEQCSLEPSRIILAPGNHDVDWKALERLHNLSMPEINSQDSFTELVQDQSTLNLLLSAQASYLSFASKYGNCSSVPHMPLSRTNHINLKNKKVTVVAVSDNLLGRIGKTSENREFDYGGLAVGSIQMHNICQSLHKHDPDITILITHHPTSYLQQWDKSVVESYLSKHFNFHFFGHLHEQCFHCTSNQIGEYISVQSGSIFSDYHGKNLYSQVTWNLNSNKINITERHYNKQSQSWVATDNSFEISLNKKSNFPDDIELVSYNLADYELVKGSSFRCNIREYKLDFDEIIEKVANIFKAHINYFRRDFEKLPIPIDTDYYLVATKCQKKIEFHMIKPCKELELSQILDWNRVILDYRKCTYFSYREPDYSFSNFPHEYKTAVRTHREIILEIRDFYKKYDKLDLAGNITKYTGCAQKIHFQLASSEQNLQEAEYYFRARRTMPPITANSQIIIHLEASLMHLHKAILSHFPGDPW